MISGIKKRIDSFTTSSPDDGLVYMREQSFIYVVFISIIIGSIVFLLSTINTVRTGNALMMVVDFIGYLVVLVVAFGGRIIPLKLRIKLFIYTSLFLGVMYLAIEGPESSGLLYIIGFNILSAIFLGLRSVIYSLIVTFLILTAFTLILYFDLLPGLKINSFDRYQFILVGINTVFISSVSIVIVIIVDNLEKIVNHKEKLQKLLHDNLENLSLAKKKAEESDRLKSSFLANMSHEIRTPMNAVLGFSDLVLSQPDLSVDETKYYVKTIYDSGQYLMKIIDDILDLSLLDSKQMKAVKKEINLRNVFSDLEIMYYPRMSDNEKVELNFKIPLTNRDMMIYTDEQRLKQVLINLINNSLKFTEEGEINVGFNINDREVEFFVKDTGAGIKKEKLATVFDRFVKADSYENMRNIQGTGLGLAISKGIVEVLGGRIWVESVEGRGSTFYFTLPCKEKPTD